MAQICLPHKKEIFIKTSGEVATDATSEKAKSRLKKLLTQVSMMRPRKILCRLSSSSLPPFLPRVAHLLLSWKRTARGGEFHGLEGGEEEGRRRRGLFGQIRSKIVSTRLMEIKSVGWVVWENGDGGSERGKFFAAKRVA